MTASSSLEELAASESIMFTLLTELPITCLSPFPVVDQSEGAALPGESGTFEPLLAR